MAIEYILEADERLTPEELSRVLATFPGAEFTANDTGMSGRLSPHGPFLYAQPRVSSPKVLAEGYGGDWPVAQRITFRLSASGFDEDMDALERLIAALQTETAARFVLSRQFDTIVAVRDQV
jgi:hypothetical protein